MGNLRILWTDIGGVQWKGKGIIEAWREEMSRKGWDIETDPTKWRECDLVFYGSDSQLEDSKEALGNKPTILYFWGWMPARLLDHNFQAIVVEQLKMMAKCTRILVPSLGTMDQVADFGLPSYLCLPGVDSKLLDWGCDHPRKRKQQVMFLSRLVPHKHLDALITAMSLIKPCPDLLVAGPGDKAPYIEMARELGVPASFEDLDDQEKVNQLRASAVLVHPSSYEGFGLPPLEALYCGTPVIAFDIPQMRWLLQEDAYYFSSVDGLAQTIGHVLDHPEEAQAKADHGSKRTRDTLTLGRACDRLQPHIHRVIKEHLAMELRTKPEDWARIYDDEHRRNWALSIKGFDPTWERHWRAQAFINALKECGAKHILDLGCGAVYPTIFARAGFEVTALDVSPEAISQVDKIAGKWGVRGLVHPVVGDAQKLVYRDSCWDAVIQGELWEHVQDVGKLVSEGLRVLKPGGYLIATTPVGEHHYDPMHLRVFDDSSIRDLIDPFLVAGKAKLKKITKIAEQGTDPSVYLVILEKL